ncbi:MAG: metal ABC transporter ATP-binding protein [Clostridia bacterium]|nr:metal ABC transporter ATP-binding protein [Clostridia bacterium]MBR2907077.1 metal ABC transporter ATP-binding protein [Clostridia bacterium]
MPQIICNDITLAYDGKPILEHLSFTVDAGECLCIVGANGTGKSTLCRALLGLVPPASGAIEFGEGLSIRDVGYLPQQTAVQRDFPASVFEIVLTGLLVRRGIRPFYTAREKMEARLVMRELGIEELKDKSYRILSGGQQQRVLLARALLAARRMILLDEPTASLDPTATQDFYALIHRLRIEKGITVLMVTHDLSAVRTESDRVLHLGKNPPFFGTIREYEASEAGREYLSMGENGSDDATPSSDGQASKGENARYLDSGTAAEGEWV